jgi:hypothetical protein
MVTNFKISPVLRFSLLVTAIVALLCAGMIAQTTVATGSIVGTVTDPSGAVVGGAKVIITNVDTGVPIDLTTNSAGAFNSGALTPATYKVQISSKGFNTLTATVIVQVGNTSALNARMTLGQESTVVEVQASSLAVNTEQAEVQGVLTTSQIENLPVNGRNFLDLAQLEPGVQIQDGQNFDPTKAGYSSISFGGRFGRTARIDVDGVDVSDETVGTTTQDIPASAINEFQMSQSSLDLSNDLTSSGAVNVTTKSGTNTYHGEAFGLIRDRNVGGAAAPGGVNAPMQRQQYGGDFGGAIIKDKLFFFMDGERTKQDSMATVQFPSPFDLYDGTITTPFRDNELMGKVDYNLGHNARLFYRYDYFGNSLPGTFGLGYSKYVNKDYTRTHVGGIDFNTGTFTHTIRFSYMKFQNQIADAAAGSGLPFCCYGVTFNARGNGFYAGPNIEAPQSTPQQNTQVKYDGSKSVGHHIFRYGFSFNHIQGGGFANFFGLGPRVRWTQPDTTTKLPDGTFEDPNAQFAAEGPYPGGITNPLNYPVQQVRYGNGMGFSTEHPALGFPAGGLGPDNRLGLYVGDSWKIRSNFTMSLGVRYVRDTGRTDSDLPADSAINAAFPGWGNRVQQPNLNFAPQLGIAWDPKGNGKTVVRGGIGLYYENVIYNNVLFDRPLRLKTGAFNQTPLGCNSGTVQQQLLITGPNGPEVLQPDAGSCGNDVHVGDAIPAILDTWAKYEAGNPLDLNAANPNYVGNSLDNGISVGASMFAPQYKSPRSLQINFGIQHELHKGTIFSADYLRNVETKSLVGIDINHTGDVATFNKTNALSAIAATNSSFECGNGTDAASIDCAIAAGAQMTDYATNGLGSAGDFGGDCVNNAGTALPCAFPGYNPAQGAFGMLMPIGRSVYNALQVKLSQNVANPLRSVRALNFQFSYSLSSFKNIGGSQVDGTTGNNDLDFVTTAADNNNPGRYFGPSLLDRTHQFSFGGYAELPAKFRIGLIGHFYSPLAEAIDIPNTNVGPGEIYRTDFTGDGSVADLMPGTHMGQFDRGTNAHSLNSLIDHYNTTYGNQATPAGQALISAGLFTLTQLQALGGVAPTVSPAPAGQVDLNWLRGFDANLAWKYTIKERFSIEPSIAFFNLPNFSNFNLPGTQLMTGILTGSSGAINGTTKADRESFRAGNGTGTYALGSARQIEFGLKLTF